MRKCKMSEANKKKAHASVQFRRGHMREAHYTLAKGELHPRTSGVHHSGSEAPGGYTTEVINHTSASCHASQPFSL